MPTDAPHLPPYSVRPPLPVAFVVNDATCSHCGRCPSCCSCPSWIGNSCDESPLPVPGELAESSTTVHNEALSSLPAHEVGDTLSLPMMDYTTNEDPIHRKGDRDAICRMAEEEEADYEARKENYRRLGVLNDDDDVLDLPPPTVSRTVGT